MNSISTYILLIALTSIIIGCTHKTEEKRDNAIFMNASQSGSVLQQDLYYPRIESFLESYEQIIKRYANRYGFDWRLILAVMNQESRFRIQAVSPMGAYGLMQIMPATGREISDTLLIDNVSHPENNIAAGVYYLWWLYTMFHPDDEMRLSGANETDRLQLALAAYNGGPSRVRDAQQLARYLNLDPYRWVHIKPLLQMLSRRYYTLHQYVWDNGRPSGGYFNGWPETINYVESVMEYYLYYKDIYE